jgi:nitrate/nitrite-specific signal transduction histidine kinase
MRIRTQIALTTALILAALAVMTLSSLYQQRVRLELANRQEKIHQMVQEAQELSILSSELLLYPSARVQAQWRLRRNAFSRLLEEQQSWLDQSGGELIADVTDEYLQLGKLFRQMEKLAPFADDVAGDALLRARLATQMLSRSRQLSALLQEFDALERAFGFAKLRRVGKRILVANFLAFGLVASLLLLLWFNLTRQLADLRRGFERVADGELDHRVNHVCRDEFGELARGFDRMTEQVACQTRRLQASQKELASINRELEQKVAERTAELDQANAELERAVRQLYDAGAELAQTERLLTLRKLVASVSHELNNPLMGALNYVQYVRSKFAEHPEIDTVGDHLDAWLAKAERDILRASRVTENLLKYDQISAGHQSALWPARLVNEVLELADPALQRAGVLAENRVEQSLRIAWSKVCARCR